VASDSGHAALFAYCRENSLPPPDGNRLFVHRNGADLLLAGGEDGRMNIWADLGKLGEFRSEEKVLAAVLETSSRLDPLHGIFIGLHAPTGRIMLRAAFLPARGGASPPLKDLLTGMAGKVLEIKASLHEEANR
jgi:hypothetical protein